MKVFLHNCFLYGKPGIFAGFALSILKLPPTMSLLLGYYYATIDLLLTTFSPGVTYAFPASCYGVAYALPTGTVRVP